MTASRLLGIFAHPDDESFGPGGTLARYAREGVGVHVCTVTDGAAGSYAPSTPVPDAHNALAQRRAQELRCACQVLDARLHTLDYRDSGMENTPDNHHPDSLYQADLEDIARDLTRVIRAVRPHVVITHDATGGYFHPDHIRVNHAVRRAWHRAGDVRAYPELRTAGYPPWRPARLYETVIPRSSLKWFILIQRLLGRDPRRFGQNQDIDLTQVGVPDARIHVRLDVGAFIAIKEKASACHASQGGNRTFRWMPGFVRRRLQRYEHFAQVYPPDAQRHNDLWEELDV
jgi:LmbE family N-acetylglucosaminyl deacetylase